MLVGELVVLAGEKCTKAPKAKPVMRPERAKRITAITATLNACESPVWLFVGLKLGLVSVCILRNCSFLRFLRFWYLLTSSYILSFSKAYHVCAFLLFK